MVPHTGFRGWTCGWNARVDETCRFSWFENTSNRRVVGPKGFSNHFWDTFGNLPLKPLYGGLVFGKPFSLYHRSGFHFPQPCSGNGQKRPNFPPKPLGFSKKTQAEGGRLHYNLPFGVTLGPQ